MKVQNKVIVFTGDGGMGHERALDIADAERVITLFIKAPN
jgi:hypothetical protein